MKCGIIVPLQFELKPFFRRSFQHFQVGNYKNYKIILSGIGYDNAARACEILHLDHDINHLISWGTCGSIDPKLKAGDIIIPTGVKIDEDYYRSSQNFSLEDKYKPIQDLSIHQKDLLHVKGLINDGVEKVSLAEKNKMSVVDMESGAIARYAYQNGLRFNSIRIVSDEIDNQIPNYIIDAMDHIGNLEMRKLIGGILSNPHTISHLIKLIRNTKKVNKSFKRIISLL